MPTLTFQPVTNARRADFLALFEGRGGPKHCWCMVWRPLDGKRGDFGPTDRRAAMLETIDAGTPVGILAYDGNEPVGWCSIAPRETYRKLGGPDDAEEVGPIWSLVCFFLRRDHRGQGIGRELLAAAIDYARREGARMIEAYPVAPDAPSYRFMGFVPLFKQAGFTELGPVGKRRHVMRLAVSAGHDAA